jgi:hypothetical protein
MARTWQLATLILLGVGTGWSLGQVPSVSPDDDILVTPPLEVAAQATILPDLSFPANDKKIPLNPSMNESANASTCAEAVQSEECCSLVGCQSRCAPCRGGLFRCRTRCCRGKLLLRRVAAFCRCRHG